MRQESRCDDAAIRQRYQSAVASIVILERYLSVAMVGRRSQWAVSRRVIFKWETAVRCASSGSSGIS